MPGADPEKSDIKRHLLLTGLPGCGKTTLVRRLVNELADLQPVGFYTEEIRHKGGRQGFRLVSLDGREGLLAHVDIHGPSRVGRYGVDLAGFEEFISALDLSDRPASLVVIDEIGKMECFSPRFVELVRVLFGSSNTLLATVARKGGGLPAEVRQRPDCRLVEVSTANRDRLVIELSDWLRRRLFSS